jgi:hypothetical protein
MDFTGRSAFGCLAIVASVALNSGPDRVDFRSAALLAPGDDHAEHLQSDGTDHARRAHREDPRYLILATDEEVCAGRRTVGFGCSRISSRSVFDVEDDVLAVVPRRGAQSSASPV